MPPTATAPLHARLAALSRHRPTDDPEIAHVRGQLGEEKLVAAVERALSKAPPLRAEVRTRIIGLLS